MECVITNATSFFIPPPPQPPFSLWPSAWQTQTLKMARGDKHQSRPTSAVFPILRAPDTHRPTAEKTMSPHGSNFSPAHKASAPSHTVRVIVSHNNFIKHTINKIQSSLLISVINMNFYFTKCLIFYLYGHQATVSPKMDPVFLSNGQEIWQNGLWPVGRMTDTVRVSDHTWCGV